MYRPRRPEATVLHKTVRENLETFVAQARGEDGSAPGLPNYVEREWRDYLECAVLARGFFRLRCASCGYEALLGLSCGGRTACASCATRRMESLTTHIANRVLPEVAFRLWTISFPFDLRRLLACDKGLLSAVHRIFVDVVFRFVTRAAAEAGAPDGRCGAVSFIQRFSSSLVLNVHVHLLAMDGVYTRATNETSPKFHETRAPSPADVETVSLAVTDRVRALLRRRGLLNKDGDPVSPESQDPTPLELLVQATSQDGVPAGHLAEGGRAEPKVPVRVPTRALSLSDLEGFSVDASVRVCAGDKAGRTRLVRYGARPPFSDHQFSETTDGRIAFALRKPRRDGATHLFFTPLALLRRISWLFAPPRQALVRYEGVLAPAARWRPLIVPTPPPDPNTLPDDDLFAPSRHSMAAATRIAWASLLKQVYLLDPLACPKPGCHGRLALISIILRPDVIRRILAHLGFASELPALAPARAPPAA